MIIEQPATAPKGQMIAVADVLRRLAIPRRQLYVLMDREARPFPPGIKLGTRRLWPEAAVVRWLEEEVRMQERDWRRRAV